MELVEQYKYLLTELDLTVLQDAGDLLPVCRGQCLLLLCGLQQQIEKASSVIGCSQEI